MAETKAAHTPGPWKLCGPNDGRNSAVVAGVEGGDPPYILCDVYKDVEEIARNAKANARLISAAPDLLAALKFFLERYVAFVASGDCGNWDVKFDPEVVKATAAIAKAEGK